MKAEILSQHSRNPIVINLSQFNICHTSTLLILFYLCLYIPQGLFLKLEQNVHISNAPSALSSLTRCPNNVSRRVQIMNLLIMQFSPFFSYLLSPSQSRYHPWHFILKLLHVLVFLPHEKWGFTWTFFLRIL